MCAANKVEISRLRESGGISVLRRAEPIREANARFTRLHQISVVVSSGWPGEPPLLRA